MPDVPSATAMARSALALAAELARARMSGSMLVWAPDGVPEVAAGDDLAALLVAALAAEDFALADGDVVVVTSKIVSKAEGRAVAGRPRGGDHLRDRAGGRPARRDPHRRDPARAGAGRGRRRRQQHRAGHRACCCPSTRTPRPARCGPRLLELAGVDVAVVVSDTLGRAWRTGLTDQAIGVAGLAPLRRPARPRRRARQRARA